MAIKHKITINPAYASTRPIIESITRNGMPADAVVIYEGSRNRLFHVGTENAPDAPEMRINVKAFRVPPFPNNYIYSGLRAGKAARSYKFAHKLLELGFDTPAPVAYSETLTGWKITGETGIWPRLGRSYYFCQQLPYPDLRYWEGRRDREAIIEALGNEIARLHAAGVWMKDFSTGNILLQPPASTTNGSYRFHYVDLNRIAFGVTNRRKLMQMFRALSCSREITLEIAAAYARAAKRDLSSTLAEAANAFDRFQLKNERKKRLKKLLKRSKS